MQKNTAQIRVHKRRPIQIDQSVFSRKSGIVEKRLRGTSLFPQEFSFLQ